MDETSFVKTVPKPQHTAVRIGDAERQAAGSQLQQHFAEGRLSWEELDERLAKAYAARVSEDLTCLFTDLPMLEPPAPPVPARSRTQQIAARLASTDVRRLIFFGLLAAIAIGATRGVIIPVFAIWWFVAAGRRGPRGPRGPYGGPYRYVDGRDRRHHHSSHGSHHHGRAWG